MRYVIFLILIIRISNVFSQGAIINEFSNGASGSKEFIELLVIGNNANPNDPVDLSGWIIDDNNGDFQSSGAEFAIGRGHFQLGSCFNSIPPGVLIVIYNDNDLNNELINQSENLMYADDCTLYIPASSDCIIRCSSSPRIDEASYSCTTTLETFKWAAISLNNDKDAVQIRKPDASFYHGFAYGDLTSPYPYFPTEFGGGSSFTISSTGTGQNYSFGSGNFTTATNFTRTGASTTDSPGDANNDANRYFINAVRDGSYNYSNLSSTSNTGTATSLKSCVCIDPVATITSANTLLTCTNTPITLDGSNSTATNTISYVWSTNETSFSISINTPGVYTLTVTNTNGASSCISTDIVEITENKVEPSVTIAIPSELTCTTEKVELTATSTVQGTASYAWSGGTTGSSDDIQIVDSSGDYTVTVTDSDNGCTTTMIFEVIQDTIEPSVTIAIPSELTCTTEKVELTATPTVQGTASYAWSGGTTGSSDDIQIVDSPGDYTVTVTDSDNGCTTATIEEVKQNIVAPDLETLTSINVCYKSKIDFNTLKYSELNDVSHTIAFYDSNNLPIIAPFLVQENDFVEMRAVSTNGCTDKFRIDLNVTLVPEIKLSSNNNLCLGDNANVLLSGNPNTSVILTDGIFDFPITLDNTGETIFNYRLEKETTNLLIKELITPNGCVFKGNCP